MSKDYPQESPQVNILSSIKYQTRCKKRSLLSIFQLILPLPFLLASFYTLKFFLLDLISGLTMVIFHIPQGLAYGLLSGLKPVNGLYASFFPPLVYSFFGTSRHISIGTFSIIAMLSSVPVLRETSMPLLQLNGTLHSNDSVDADTDYERMKLQISIATTLLAGLLQIALGLLQFGCLMSYMSDALIDSFTSAAAVHVVMSQLSNLLGYSIKSFSGIGELPYKVYMFGRQITNIHLPTVIVSVICIIILSIFCDYINPIFKKKFRFPLPIQFLLVVLTTVISYYANINGRFQIKIVGPVPKGIPMPLVPDISIWSRVLPDAILLAVIGFVINSSLVKVYSLKFSYDVNFNQEAFAYGLSNVVGSFFRCTMSAAALARSAVVVDVGMKSQVASLVSCLCMLLILLFIGPLFTTVPKAVLSAIILVSLKGMLKKPFSLPKLWYLSKYDFAVWVVTYCLTLALNIPYGLVFGFIFSLITVLLRNQNPKFQTLGCIPNTEIYRNLKLFRDAQEMIGIKIFRYDAPLYFGNAEHFQSKVYRKSGVNPNTIASKKTVNKVETGENDNMLDKVENGCREIETNDNETKLDNERSDQLKYIIFDFSSTNYIDNVGIRILDDIYRSYLKVGITVYLASPNSSCRDMLERAKFADENRNRISFLTVHDAVLSTGLCVSKAVEE